MCLPNIQHPSPNTQHRCRRHDVFNMSKIARFAPTNLFNLAFSDDFLLTKRKGYFPDTPQQPTFKDSKFFGPMQAFYALFITFLYAIYATDTQ